MQCTTFAKYICLVHRFVKIKDSRASAQESFAIIHPKDIVLEELSNIAKNMDVSSEELSMAMAIYLLGFSSYSGFTKSQDENMINRIYEYAKRINKI